MARRPAAVTRLAMTLRILRAALRHERSRVALAGLAVGLAVTLPAAVVGLGEVRGKLARELEAYGANLLVVPRTGASLDGRSLALLERMRVDGRLEAYAPVLTLIARVAERTVAVTGTRFPRARELYRWWDVEGTWPEDGSGALLGANAAGKLGRAPGDPLTIEARGVVLSLRVRGVVRSGGPEENQVFVDLAAAQRLAGRPGRVSLVHGRAQQSRDLPALTRALEAAMTDAEVRTPLQVVRAEEQVLGRLQRLLLLMGSVILAAAVLALSATMAAAALEHRREVGVMRALGAEVNAVVRLLAAEAAAIGLAGGVLGGGLGAMLAEAVAWRAFGAPVAPSAQAVLAGLALGLGTSLAAGLGPLYRAARVPPVTALRGE